MSSAKRPSQASFWLSGIGKDAKEIFQSEYQKNNPIEDVKARNRKIFDDNSRSLYEARYGKKR